jgi:hypothetical protein
MRQIVSSSPTAAHSSRARAEGTRRFGRSIAPGGEACLAKQPLQRKLLLRKLF